jgi:hypothetical protein
MGKGQDPGSAWLDPSPAANLEAATGKRRAETVWPEASSSSSSSTASAAAASESVATTTAASGGGDGAEGEAFLDLSAVAAAGRGVVSGGRLAGRRKRRLRVSQRRTQVHILSQRRWGRHLGSRARRESLAELYMYIYIYIYIYCGAGRVVHHVGL